MISSNVSGIVKGSDWRGIEGGSGGSFDGAERTRRGASRRGSTCLRYVVKMSGRSFGSRKGRSRLSQCQRCRLHGELWLTYSST